MGLEETKPSRKTNMSQGKEKEGRESTNRRGGGKIDKGSHSIKIQLEGCRTVEKRRATIMSKVKPNRIEGCDPSEETGSRRRTAKNIVHWVRKAVAAAKGEAGRYCIVQEEVGKASSTTEHVLAEVPSSY